MQLKKQQLEPDINNGLVPNWKRSTSRLDIVLSPCLFNLYAEYIMRNVRLDERQAEISITSDMQMRSPYGRKQRRTKEPLDESKRGE